jgi:hypothetical protein
MICKESVGAIIVVLGTIIGVLGTFVNNVFLDHVTAMQIWRWSNFLLLAFFVGLWKKWWTSSIGAEVMCLLYAFYIITNEWGLDLA